MERQDDVIKVIRCKNCEHKKEWVKNGVGEYFCRCSGLWNLTDDCFCHRGEIAKEMVGEQR